ncbi:MAG: hypothetical protein PHG08_09360 [Bacilli bacterium]|nr:hypothetical protein [Bacilli bacterium]
MANHKALKKWSEKVFLNQAKIGEVMAKLEDEKEFSLKECLKNGIKIHKRHRELLQEVALDNDLPPIDDVVNVNKRILEKFQTRKLKTKAEKIKVVIDATYDTMKTIEYFVLMFKQASPKIRGEVHHLRQGYLAFIDDLHSFSGE